MPLPVDHTIEPMLAKAVSSVPATAPGGGGLLYEPKWDGFRGDRRVRRRDVEIGSRGGKTLTRYFPELVEGLAAALPGPCVLDGEVVVPTGEPGAQRLDWEALSQRIHPAASRIAKLSLETPASFIAFDLLAEGDRSLLDAPFGERRAALTALLPAPAAPLFVSQVTDDAALAERWLAEFEGAGLDGVVAKPVDAVYSPGKRTMLKIKHHRSADVIATGLPDPRERPRRRLAPAVAVRRGGGAAAGRRRLGLHHEGPRRADRRARAARGRDEHGEPVRGQGERNRFSSSKDTSFVVLRPERVLEVRYDQMEGDRFRHTVQLERWRPDREARSCTFEQLEVPHAYDLGGRCSPDRCERVDRDLAGERRGQHRERAARCAGVRMCASRSAWARQRSTVMNRPGAAGGLGERVREASLLGLGSPPRARGGGASRPPPRPARRGMVATTSMSVMPSDCTRGRAGPHGDSSP